MIAPFRVTMQDSREGLGWKTVSEHGTLEAAKDARYILRKEYPVFCRFVIRDAAGRKIGYELMGEYISPKKRRAA